MGRNKGMGGRMLWELLSPLFLYYLLSVTLAGILEGCLPALAQPENAMWLLTLVNGLQIPVFLYLYRRQGGSQARAAAAGSGALVSAAWKRAGAADLLTAVLGGVLLSRGFNGLIGLSPLPQLFPGYQTASEAMYGGSLLSLAAASVAAASVLEETLMRGLLYERLRRSLPDLRPAILLSALVFALFHGNVVQGVYAFLTGLYFAWLYEAYRSLLPPVLAHGAANAAGILLEQTGWLDGLYESLPVCLAATVLCLAGGAFCWRRALKAAGAGH